MNYFLMYAGLALSILVGGVTFKSAEYYYSKYYENKLSACRKESEQITKQIADLKYDYLLQSSAIEKLKKAETLKNKLIKKAIKNVNKAIVDGNYKIERLKDIAIPNKNENLCKLAQESFEKELMEERK